MKQIITKHTLYNVGQLNDEIAAHLYGPFYTALSRGATLPLHRHIRPFTANGALLPRDGHFYPRKLPIGREVRGWSAPALKQTAHVVTVVVL